MADRLESRQVSGIAFVEYVKNRYYFLCNINRKDAQIIANCPIPDARRMLLRKYIDEEGQDVAGGRPSDRTTRCG
jgi:pyrroloquinoline quinone (PQQ) biosynthesis protein C